MIGKRDILSKWARKAGQGKANYQLQATHDHAGFRLEVTARDRKVESIELVGVKMGVEGIEYQTAQIDLDTALGLLGMVTMPASQLAQLAASQGIPMPTGLLGLPNDSALRGLFCAAILRHPQGPPAAVAA